KWISSSGYDNLLRSGTHFMDKTDDDDNDNEMLARSAVASVVAIKNTYEIPTEVEYFDLTKRAQRNLNMNRAKGFLTKLSSFYTRFYNTTTGIESSKFIRNHVKSIVKGYRGRAEVKEFKHKWAQSSIIVRIPGVVNPDEIVILGAHLDSINQTMPETGRSPGADDDGSGVALLTEVLHSLVSANFIPSRTIEFQFYSAEEVGLLGSADIARTYKRSRKNVVAMLHQDMVGYKEKGVDTMRVQTDFVDQELTTFISKLITTYTPYPVFRDTCGYACSDHASFYEKGYKTAIQSETVLARGYHTDLDVIEDMDFDYFKEFCKVGVAYAIEIAE
ncbi:Zn-dependent exopeptidase, partial [Conidiobolus coronatus NRRL 28638]